MRRIRKHGFMLVMMAALAFAFGSSAMAFHGARNLVCNKCHTMHNLEDGAVIDADGPNPHLLIQSNTTDLCLSCHQESDPAFADGDDKVAPFVRSTTGAPTIALSGGDYWSSAQQDGTEDYIGARGHNPGYEEGSGDPGSWSDAIPDDEHTADPLTPPGGTGGVLSKWDCVSCHAPHRGDDSDDYGEASAFRMLWEMPAGEGSGVTFGATGDDGTGSVTDQPVYTWELDESDTNHTAYEEGVADWCGQCHDVIHTTVKVDGDWLRHPTGVALSDASGFAVNYNIITGQGSGSGYSFIVPIEDANATTNDFGATADLSKVMCLSCHRAHGAATNGDAGYVDTMNMTRWDMDAASGANSNCNKCHAKG